MILAYLTSQYARASDTFVRREVRLLRQRGHSVHTFSIRRPDGAVDQEITTEQANTLYLVEAGAPRLMLAGLRTLCTQPRRFLLAAALNWRSGMPGVRQRLWQVMYLMEACLLAAELRRRGVQHLHNHIAENSATVAMLASILSGVPYSMTVHGPGIFFHARQWALDQKIARSAFTACISDFCRSQCMIFAPPDCWDRLHIVRCGVGERFLKDDPPPVPDVARFVCVGRLCAEKGQAMLVEAIARLRDDGFAAELVLVGDGELRPMLERRIAALKLTGRVTITGWADSDAVRRRLVDARAMVMASFAEGLPVVIMEALALGRPVIATQIAAIPELVRPGETGWLAPAGNIDALTQAMRQALTAPVAELAAMGRCGRQLVAQRHDAQTECGRLEALIEQSVRRAASGYRPPMPA